MAAIVFRVSLAGNPTRYVKVRRSAARYRANRVLVRPAIYRIYYRKYSRNLFLTILEGDVTSN